MLRPSAQEIEPLGFLIQNFLFFMLDGLNLTGTIPRELSALSLMSHLTFLSNGLTGTLPESLGDLSLLERIEISEGRITGVIPESFGNWDRLNHFEVFGLLP